MIIDDWLGAKLVGLVSCVGLHSNQSVAKTYCVGYLVEPIGILVLDVVGHRTCVAVKMLIEHFLVINYK